METQTLFETDITDQPNSLSPEPTEHPHVVWIRSSSGRTVVLNDVHIHIWVLASLFRDGSTVQDLIETYPHAKPAAIYDAISYYLDHTADIDQEIERNKIENVLAENNAQIDAGGFMIFDK